jgi:hypothetical protein
MMAICFPWDTEPAPVAPSRPPDAEPRPNQRRGRRPRVVAERARAATPDPPWLYHHLIISGPAAAVAAFAASARGAGVTPWQLDLAMLEEDIFNLAAAQPPSGRNLSIAGCRILARQFRERVEQRQARAIALVGHSQACPFDLHALLPVPEGLCSLGPTHPDAVAWLAQQWGVTDRLRQIALLLRPRPGRRLPQHHAAIGYGFFTGGETPQAAIATLAARWPMLHFVLRPLD